MLYVPLFALFIFMRCIFSCFSPLHSPLRHYTIVKNIGQKIAKANSRFFILRVSAVYLLMRSLSLQKLLWFLPFSPFFVPFIIFRCFRFIVFLYFVHFSSFFSFHFSFFFRIHSFSEAILLNASFWRIFYTEGVSIHYSNIFSHYDLYRYSPIWSWKNEQNLAPPRQELYKRWTRRKIELYKIEVLLMSQPNIFFIILAKRTQHFSFHNEL